MKTTGAALSAEKTRWMVHGAITADFMTTNVVSSNVSGVKMTTEEQLKVLEPFEKPIKCSVEAADVAMGGV